MRSYRRTDIEGYTPRLRSWRRGADMLENAPAKHKYRIQYGIVGCPNGDEAIWEGYAATQSEAMKQVWRDLPRGAKVDYIISISIDGDPVPGSMVNDYNKQYYYDGFDKAVSRGRFVGHRTSMRECDAGGGAAAGGDAGGAVAGGDAGGSAPAGDASAVDATDSAASSMTTTADVLGKCEPGKGYMGPGNFYIPFRARFPLSRVEAAYGGSRRKKKKKKQPYEKGMKVVVKMFEDDEEDAS